MLDDAPSSSVAFKVLIEDGCLSKKCAGRESYSDELIVALYTQASIIFHKMHPSHANAITCTNAHFVFARIAPEIFSQDQGYCPIASLVVHNS